MLTLDRKSWRSQALPGGQEKFQRWSGDGSRLEVIAPNSQTVTLRILTPFSHKMRAIVKDGRITSEIAIDRNEPIESMVIVQKFARELLSLPNHDALRMLDRAYNLRWAYAQARKKVKNVVYKEVSTLAFIVQLAFVVSLTALIFFYNYSLAITGLSLTAGIFILCCSSLLRKMSHLVFFSLGALIFVATLLLSWGLQSQ